MIMKENTQIRENMPNDNDNANSNAKEKNDTRKERSFFEGIFGDNKGNNALYLILGVIGGVVGGYFLFGKSKEKEIEELKKQLDEIKKENQQFKSKLNDLEKDALSGTKARKGNRNPGFSYAYFE